MPKPVMLHGCYDIHVKKEKRAPNYRAERDGNWGPIVRAADYTLCGLSAERYYWRRRPVLISEKSCRRTVTCKSCRRSIESHRRATAK